MLAFADDVVLLSYSQTGLQKCLDKLQSYCIKWKLNVNMKKTKIVVFNTKKLGHKLYFCGLPISESKSYTYLGVLFSKNGNLCNAMNTLNNKAMKAQFSLRQNMANAPVKIFLKLYDSLIKPISTYGAEVWSSDVIKWGDSNLEDLLIDCKHKFNLLHARFCKHLLSVNRNCANILALGELGRYPVFIDICSRIVNFWAHARQSPKDSLVYICSSIESDNIMCGYSSIVSKILGKDVDFAILTKDETTALLKSVKTNLKHKYEIAFSNSLNR